jgi:hypothetical protein
LMAEFVGWVCFGADILNDGLTKVRLRHPGKPFTAAAESKSESVSTRRRIASLDKVGDKLMKAPSPDGRRYER